MGCFERMIKAGRLADIRDPFSDRAAFGHTDERWKGAHA
jgi:hypothetical protein